MAYRWFLSSLLASFFVFISFTSVSAEIVEIRVGSGMDNLELAEEKYLFAPGEKVYLWARVIIKKPGTFWYVIKREGNVVRRSRPMKVGFPDRNGYRFWRWNVFFESGTYQARVVDSKGTVVAAGTFRVR
jgi:hypothetical protein